MLTCTVRTSNAILALCNGVARRGPNTYRPINPFTGEHCNVIFVVIPADADWQDYENLRWLLDHPRKGVVLKYDRSTWGVR